MQSDSNVLRLLQDECDKKDNCNVSPINETFAFIECQNVDRSVEILNRCDGGQDGTVLLDHHSCETCGDRKRGQMVQKDLNGRDSLTIICEGGCIKIMKVLCSCKLKKAQQIPS